MAPWLPADAPGPVPSRLPPLDGSRHPGACGCSTSDTSTVTTDPTRTKQAPGHSLTGRRETQTAERREKEREREVEREVQKWASSTACKEQCEKHWRGDAHGVEAMGGEGATVTLARPRGTFHPRNRSRGPTSLPQPCPNTNPAEGWRLQGTRASEPPGHGCGSWMKSAPRKGCSANGPGCWKSPVLPAQRLCPMQGQHGHGGSQPAPSQLCTAPWWGAGGHCDAVPGPPAAGPLHPLPGQRGESPAGAAKSTD